MKKNSLHVMILILLSNVFCTKAFSQKEVIKQLTITNPLKYHTMEAEFLYENFISAYHDYNFPDKGSDKSGWYDGAIVKENQYVVWDGKKVNKKSYLNGMYLIGNFYIDYINPQKKFIIRYDSASINRFKRPLGQYAFDGIINNNIGYNPYCGVYYLKYHIKCEVLFVGNISQRIPVFYSCKTVGKRGKQHKKHYEIRTIPTYLITNIFEWKEIDFPPSQN